MRWGMLGKMLPALLVATAIVAPREAGAESTPRPTEAPYDAAGRRDPFRPPRAVAAAGNYAYVSEGPNVTVLNVTVTSRPLVAGKIRMHDFVRGIAVSGSLAYLAVGEWGLQIVNIANPTSPTFRGRTHAWQPAYV